MLHRFPKLRVRTRHVRPCLEVLEDRLAPAILTVTNNSDTGVSGDGSLRGEIAAAAAGDTVVFAPSLAGQVITLTQGTPLVLSRDLTIQVVPSSQIAVSGSNAAPGQVFTVNAGVTATITGLLIENGQATAGVGVLGGGGIDNEGNLTLNNDVISNNTISAPAGSNALGGGIFNDTGATLILNATTVAGNKATAAGTTGVFDALGGGIYNLGALTVNGGSVSNNSAQDTGINAGTQGGGIFNAVAGTLTVTGSTVASNNANSSSRGAGLENDGTATITNSTIANNVAADNNGSSAEGGGIENFGGQLTVINSTVVYNSVASSGSNAGGGIDSRANGAITPTLNLLNTIVYNPHGANTGTGPDVNGTIDNAQNDLFGSAATGAGFTITNDKGGNQFSANPLLGAPQDNGGPTQTYALLPGSPAIDAGANTSMIAGATVPTADQRGFNRPVNGITDIGAYEFQPPGTATTLAASGTALQPGEPVLLAATVAGLAPGSNTPQGSVTFLDGATPLGTVALGNGVAYLITALPAGNNVVTAVYNGFTQGDFAFATSTSNAVPFTVVPSTPVIPNALVPAGTVLSFPLAPGLGNPVVIFLVRVKGKKFFLTLVQNNSEFALFGWLVLLGLTPKQFPSGVTAFGAPAVNVFLPPGGSRLLQLPLKSFFPLFVAGF